MKVKRYLISLALILAAFLVGRYLLPARQQPTPAVKIPLTDIRLVDPAGGKLDWASPSVKQITLAKALEKRGVRPEDISQLCLVGDEASVGSNIKVVVTDKDEIEWLWSSMVSTAEPYSHWVASGDRILQVYTGGGKQLATTLFVNETDATHVDGIDGRFMCHGLHDYIMDKFEKKGLTTE